MSERITLGDVRPFSPAVLSSGEYATPERSHDGRFAHTGWNGVAV